MKRDWGWTEENGWPRYSDDLAIYKEMGVNPKDVKDVPPYAIVGGNPAKIFHHMLCILLAAVGTENVMVIIILYVHITFITMQQPNKCGKSIKKLMMKKSSQDISVLVVKQNNLSNLSYLI